MDETPLDLHSELSEREVRERLARSEIHCNNQAATIAELERERETRGYYRNELMALKKKYDADRDFARRSEPKATRLEGELRKLKRKHAALAKELESRPEDAILIATLKSKLVRCQQERSRLRLDVKYFQEEIFKLAQRVKQLRRLKPMTVHVNMGGGHRGGVHRPLSNVAARALLGGKKT